MSQRAVYKSTAVEFLDEMFSGSPEQLGTAFDDALGLLAEAAEGHLSQAAAHLADEGTLPDGIGTVEQFTHDWLADDGPMAGQDVNTILRLGYREAIRLARETTPPVPIETLWVTGTGDTFEIHITEGKDRVIVSMLIPLVRPYGSERAQARSWVVRARTDGDDEGDDEVQVLETGERPVVMVRTSGKRSTG